MSIASHEFRHSAIIGVKILLTLVVLLVGASVLAIVKSIVKEHNGFGLGAIPQTFYMLALFGPGLYVTWRSRRGVFWRIMTAVIAPIVGIGVLEIMMLLLTIAFGALMGGNLLYGAPIIALASAIVAFLTMRWSIDILLSGDDRQVHPRRDDPPKTTDSMPSLEERLEQLRSLRNRGLVTEEIYAERQREILKDG